MFENTDLGFALQEARGGNQVEIDVSSWQYAVSLCQMLVLDIKQSENMIASPNWYLEWPNGGRISFKFPEANSYNIRLVRHGS